MYASHRDACILARYAHDLSNRLDEFYKANDLSGNVIAYRRLGRSNYDFSADAYLYCLEHTPCVVLCFDITGFFDNLDHGILKARLKSILGRDELPDDWYKVFRHVTKFRKVERDSLAAHPIFGLKLKLKNSKPIAKIADIKAAGIEITRNQHLHGIPQGTPISSSLSNLYMMEIDKMMASICASRNALYQRYSDDILIACKLTDEDGLAKALTSAVERHKLKIKDEKTERAIFSTKRPKPFQYLGFNVSPQGACIRPGSLSRQWRKLKRNIRRAKGERHAAMKAGEAEKIYTKKLRKKFSPVGARNFSSYARRAARAFGSPAILRQVRCLERAADQAIRELIT